MLFNKIPSLVICLTLVACNNTSHYVEDSFFSNKTLGNNGLSQLEAPLGTLLYYKGYGNNEPQVFVKTGDSVEEYAQKVYDYLQNERGYTCIYSVSGVNQKYSTQLINRWSYNLKEATTLNDFYLSEDSSWYFVYSNTWEEKNADGDGYLYSAKGIKICNEGGDVEYDKKTFNYDWYIQIMTNSTFWFMND